MGQFAKYKILTDVRCPEFKPKKNKTLWYKEFKKGDVILGYINEQKIDNINIAPHIIAQGRWRIPLKYLQKQSAVPDASIEGAEQINVIASNKQLATIVKKSQNSINGALIGMIAGWILFSFIKQNKFMGAFIGSISGGLIGNQIYKQQLKNT